MCLYPKLITNPKYKKNKKNGGEIPPLKDNRVLNVPIGCGQCIECRKQKANQWKIRMIQELKKEQKGYFVTLTFSNEAIAELDKCIKKDIDGWERDNIIATLAVRRMLERWRKEFKKSIRHWFITELGHRGTENIHIHGIIWTEEKYEKFVEKWSYGWVFPNRKEDIQKNYVSNRTINYIVKYVTKVDKDHKDYKQIILTSAGIGNNYKNTIQELNNRFKDNGKTDEMYRYDNGGKSAIPTYYRNMVYSEEEREKLWLEKLDKEKRYVLGNEIDISRGEEEYERQLKDAQRINSEEGYGTGEVTWEEKEYARRRRNMLRETRIKKGREKK